jgi:hypothetical protein
MLIAYIHWLVIMAFRKKCKWNYEGMKCISCEYIDIRRELLVCRWIKAKLYPISPASKNSIIIALFACFSRANQKFRMKIDVITGTLLLLYRIQT